MKINIKWIGLGILIFILAASVYAAFTDESRWVGVRSTGDTISISAKNQKINISNHGFKEWNVATTVTSSKISVGAGIRYISMPEVPFNDITFNMVNQAGTTPCTVLNLLEMNSLGVYTNISINTELTPKKGYLINVSSNCNFVITGNPISINGMDLEKGWNLIASPYSTINFRDANPGTCTITSGPWYFNGTNIRTNTLEAGKGYLIYTANACELGISDNFNGKMTQLIINPTDVVNDAETYRFKLVDSDGYIIYDGTDTDYNGRTIIRKNIPLLGETLVLINVTSALPYNYYDIKLAYK